MVANPDRRGPAEGRGRGGRELRLSSGAVDFILPDGGQPGMIPISDLPGELGEAVRHAAGERDGEAHPGSDSGARLSE